VIDVHACAVNFPDVLIIQGLYQFKPEPPFSPGAEVAGIVRSVGDGVTSVSAGARVFASTGWGGLAEQVTVAAESVIPVPDGVDLVHASAFLYAYGTSHHALKDRAELRPGETLLVLGAAGGVGLAAVELGAHMGAAVIAAASTDEKLALCTDHGASMTINYATEDLKSRVRELTGGLGVDVVYDAVGGPYSEPALRSTGWGGRYLVIGRRVLGRVRRPRAGAAPAQRRRADRAVAQRRAAATRLVDVSPRSGGRGDPRAGRPPSPRQGRRHGALTRGAGRITRPRFDCTPGARRR
jgi:NADPH2:quinone reductase